MIDAPRGPRCRAPRQRAIGTGLADVLFGDINPSDRLTETLPPYRGHPGVPALPRRTRPTSSAAKDCSSATAGTTPRALDVPTFGHGLSTQRSTTTIWPSNPGPTESGSRCGSPTPVPTDGREIVQVYLGAATSSVSRPPRKLKGFANVGVAAGESVPVSVFIPRDDIAYWDTRVHRLVVESGSYTVHVGSSSRDIRLSRGRRRHRRRGAGTRYAAVHHRR